MTFAHVYNQIQVKNTHSFGRSDTLSTTSRRAGDIDLVIFWLNFVLKAVFCEFVPSATLVLVTTQT